jgi:hypothetical protein
MVSMLGLLKFEGSDNIPQWLKSNPDVEHRIATAKRAARLLSSKSRLNGDAPKFGTFKERLAKVLNRLPAPPAEQKSIPAGRDITAGFTRIGNAEFEMLVPTKWKRFGTDGMMVGRRQNYHAEHGYPSAY